MSCFGLRNTCAIDRAWPCPLLSYVMVVVMIDRECEWNEDKKIWDSDKTARSTTDYPTEQPPPNPTHRHTMQPLETQSYNLGWCNSGQTPKARGTASALSQGIVQFDPELEIWTTNNLPSNHNSRRTFGQKCELPSGKTTWTYCIHSPFLYKSLFVLHTLQQTAAVTASCPYVSHFGNPAPLLYLDTVT